MSNLTTIPAPAIPALTLDSLIAYRDTGRPTGSFSEAIISGDLYGAMRRGDNENLLALTEICRWMVSHMPVMAYGSPSAYRAWIAMFRNLREDGAENVRYDHGTGKVVVADSEGECIEMDPTEVSGGLP